jgi:hypothetical protein
LTNPLKLNALPKQDFYPIFKIHKQQKVVFVSGNAILYPRDETAPKIFIDTSLSGPSIH